MGVFVDPPGPRAPLQTTTDATLFCPGCRAGLRLHQPDDDDPDHLLGVCTGCGAWLVLAMAHGRPRVAARFPEPRPRGR